jgi:hypothetical protein
MSDTPRTDAHTVDGQYRVWDGSIITLQSWDYFPVKDGYGEVVHVEFARELECELNAVTAERDELLKDKARLKYLLQEAVTLLRVGKQQFTPHTTNSEVDDFIGRFDAAQRGEGQP